jgi:hypothetical protein
MMIRCTYYLRTEEPHGDYSGGYRYDLLKLRGAGELPDVATTHPPLVGDLVRLWAADGQPGECRVIERQWNYPTADTPEWPPGERVPRVGPSLYLIVERAADGIFVDVSTPEPLG